MGELVTQLTPRGKTLAPIDHQRIANASAMSVLLIPFQRRIRRHSPAMGKIAMSVRSANIIDTGNFLCHRFWAQIERPHCIDQAKKPAFLAGTIVRQHQD